MAGLANASNTQEYTYVYENLDLNVLGPVLLFTTFNTTLPFLLKEFIFQTTAFTGPITVFPTYNLGTNGPTYDNFVTGQSNIYQSVSDYFPYTGSNFFNFPLPAIAGNSGFYINIIQASDAPVCVTRIIMKGNYTI